MLSPLPHRPNPVRLRKLAKDMLRAHRAGDTSCCELLRHLKQLARRSDAEVLAAGVSLVEVQYALALHYGFASWKDLMRHAESARGAPKTHRPAAGTELAGLEWVPRAVSHMGCLEGCVRHLGLGISPAWLYGGTGHAFFINVDEDLCPSGPHSWPYFDVVPRLVRNLGVETEVLTAFPWDEKHDFDARREEVWHSVRSAIDAGVPCYGWHYEFIVIRGYDDGGYILSGPIGAPGVQAPRAWREFGASAGPGSVEMALVRPGQPASDQTVVSEALSFAVENARSREGRTEWGGLAAYDKWARGLASGATISSDGAGMHAAMWAECRAFAVEFLRQARKRLTGRADSALDRTIESYAQVRDSLREVAALFPPCLGAAGPEDLTRARAAELKAYARDQGRRNEAAALVRKAGRAEEAGVAALEAALPGLG